MKKLVLTLTAFFAVLGAYAQQCTPNASTPAANGVYPAVTATANQALVPTVLTIVAKQDTSFSINVPQLGAQTLPLRITELVFDSVNGFPQGLPAGTTNDAQATSLYNANSNPSPLTLTYDSLTGPSIQRACVILEGTPTTAAGTTALVARVDGYIQMPAAIAGFLTSGFPPLLPAPCPNGFPNPFLVSTPPSCITSNPIVGGAINFDQFRVLSFPVNITVNGPTAISELENKYGFSVYPNPISVDSRISFNLNGNERVSIEVLDVAGRNLRALENGTLTAGTHTYSLPTDLTAGVYLLRTTIGGINATTKLVVR
jgi:hypothetical protein